jgi:endonuclease/exonuclease/phosphatase family metal-dependent hydrolase
MKVISLNIWDLPVWYVEKRKERNTTSARYFRSLGADIICLQESFDLADRDLFHRELSKSEYGTTDTALAKRRFLGLPFDTTGGLVVFSKFPILSTEFFPFSRFLNASPVEFFPRKGVLVVRLSTPYGEVRVVNLHLHMESPLLSRRIRLRQLRYALERAGDGSVPTVLAGDFNQHNVHEAEDFTQLLHAAGFQHTDAHVVGLSYRPENPFVSHHLFNRTGNAKRYDFIFYRNFERVRLRPADGGILPVPEPLSDHDPVLLTFTHDGL